MKSSCLAPVIGLGSEGVQRGFRGGSEGVRRGLGGGQLSELPLNPYYIPIIPSLLIEYNAENSRQ